MIRILIPLDGSTYAEEALRHAYGIARTFPAELTLLRVITDSNAASTVRVDSLDLAIWRHQALTYLKNIEQTYDDAPNVSIRSVVLEGNPADAITQFAKTSKPDLIVLTRYGDGNAQNYATGGTAQKVVANVDASVMLLDPRTASHAAQYRRILVPVDDSKESEYALAIGAMLAECHGAQLLLTHVADEPHLPSGLPSTEASRRLMTDLHRLIHNEANRRLCELSATLPDTVRVETQTLICSDIAFAIDSIAQERECDLILLYSTPPDNTSIRRYGPTVHSLLEYSHRPLLVMKPPAKGYTASNFRSAYLEEPCLDVG